MAIDRFGQVVQSHSNSQRRKPAALAVLACVATAVSGCSFLAGLVGTNRVTVRLVNNSDFPVDVRIAIDDQQDVIESAIDDLGTELDFTLAAGESTEFSRDCDSLQAIKVIDAKLQVAGAIGPTAQSSILRDGDEFNCGDTIVFTFDHSGIIVDFDVSFAVIAGP